MSYPALNRTYRLWDRDVTLRAFINDVEARVMPLMGPIGGGKTTAAIMKSVMKVNRTPANGQGVRQRRLLIVRDTYRNLNRTTIKSWREWMPSEAGDWRGGRNEPAEHDLVWGGAGGSENRLHVDFVAIGDNDVEDVCRGYEVSDVYLNEMDRLPREAMLYLNGRIGRWPGPALGGCWAPQLWGDLNAPDVDNYVYQNFIEDLPETWRFYRQPGGLDPNAENLQNLMQTPETLKHMDDPAWRERILAQGRTYYTAQMIGQPAWYVRRMIHNEFGYSREGDPVYEEYDDQVHCAIQPIRPDPSLPLVIGADAGRTPAVELAQVTPDDQMLGITEMVAKNTTAGAFGEQVSALLERDFGASYKIPWIMVDPSAFMPHDTDEVAWAEIFEEKTGIPCIPAESNALERRLNAVSGRLRRFLPMDGRNVPKAARGGVQGRPAMLISPEQRVLRRGFNSGYMFEKVKIGKTERLRDVPAKTAESHPHDAWQYLTMGCDGEAAALSRDERRNKALDASASPRQKFHVFGEYL